ncbi:hypothetical protein PQG02_00210 (plasmid) [Nostoc sp. UHCC 0926]|uniref:hypothetical protein n=1 Tax=Nostoc sp. UHCC 0926 TaxID=3025190 RepID=UPI002360D708|nr:hypothetical protein [Nostoc sp. UHCC 0926]WDD30110.1 hypothetical protein PQG02_00210 [Nostoc sp. UHCC 0926]
MLQTIDAQMETYNSFKGIKELKSTASNTFTEDVTRSISKQPFITGFDTFLKTCVFQKKGMNPRTFCRRWFGLEGMDNNGRFRYTENLILAMESEHGYREKCINLLARLLKIKPNTIHRWGKGVEFDKIPPDKREQYETYLGYVDTIRVLTSNLANVNKDLLRKIFYNL